MSERPDLIGALREVESRWTNDRVSPEADARIRESLADERTAHRARWLLPASAVAIGLAAFLIVRNLDTEPTLLELSGFTLQRGSCDSVRVNDHVRVEGTCTLNSRDGVFAIHIVDVALVKKIERGVSLSKGRASFTVEPARRNDRVRRVRVRGGAIEVVGTEFTVRHGDDEGEVVLHHGKIRFVHDNGAVESMAPGERFEWQVDMPAVDVPQAVTQPRKRPHKRSKAAPNEAPAPSPLEPKAAAIIERVNHLRAQRRYREAVRLLRAAPQASWSQRTREVLSFELGTLLTHIGDGACVHWHEHVNQFPNGRYDVQAEIDRLGCE